MKAMAITSPGKVEMREVERPVPQAGQVGIRVKGCGVCASNLGPWQGLPGLSYPLPPAEGGHEGWGTVEEIGSDVVGVERGTHVAFISNNGWAEYTVAEANSTIILPDVLSDVPFPGEAFGCAVNIFRRSRIQPGEVVAVVGIGFLGAALCRLASDRGAEVIAISRRDSSLQLATRCGAAHVVKMDDHERIVAQVRAITNGRMCARVIEAVGLQGPLDLASELTAERGTLIIAGYHQDGPRQVNVQQWNWRGIDVVNAHERDPGVYVSGVRRAISEVLAGTLDPRLFVTHTYPLSELARALDDTANKPEGFVKAVVVP